MWRKGTAPDAFGRSNPISILLGVRPSEKLGMLNAPGQGLSEYFSQGTTEAVVCQGTTWQRLGPNADASSQLLTRLLEDHVHR